MSESASTEVVLGRDLLPDSKETVPEAQGPLGSSYSSAGHQRGVLPQPDEIRPGVWSIPVPFRPEIPWTCCYLVLDSFGGAHLIDPGFDSSETRQFLTSTLSAIGISLEDLVTLTTTHLHGDHFGLANWLSARNGLSIHMHPADLDDITSGAAETRYSDDVQSMGDRWGVPTGERWRLERSPFGTPLKTSLLTRVSPVGDGELLPIPGRRVRVIHTPGHTRGHICLSLPEEGLLLTGDHVLPRMNPGLGLGGHPPGHDPVADYLHSLDRLAEHDDDEIAPGHGYRFKGLAARRGQIKNHVLRRAREVDASLAADQRASIWKIASRLTWSGGLSALIGNRLQSALRQTEMYTNFVHNGGLPQYSNEHMDN